MICQCIDSTSVPVASQRVLNKANGFGEGCKRFSEIRTWQPQYRLQNTVINYNSHSGDNRKPETEGVDFQGLERTRKRCEGDQFKYWREYGEIWVAAQELIVPLK